jgi:hypothetical protein
MHRHEALEFYICVHGVGVYVCTHIFYSTEKMYCMKFEAALCINTSNVVFN